MGAREKDQSDFDLERFIDMFDEALTSNDERVVNALRSLMMIVVLTKPESDASVDRARGPLRRMFDDQGQILRRLERVEQEVRNSQSMGQRYGEYESYKKIRDEWGGNMWKTQPLTSIDDQWPGLPAALRSINSPATSKIPK